MANLLSLLNNAATRGGLPKDDKSLIDLLSKSDLKDIEVSDTIANAIDNGLMTEAEAKNSYAIKKHFTAQSLDPIDKHITETAKAKGFSEDQIAELTSIKSSYDRQKKFTELLEEQVAATAGKNSKPSDEAARQLAEAQEKISQLTSERDQAKSEADAKLYNYRLQSTIDQALSSYPLADHLKNDPDHLEYLNLKFKKQLEQTGAKIKLTENGTIDLVNANDETLPFTEGNKNIDFRTFTDKFMAPNIAAAPPAQATTTTVSAPASTTAAPKQNAANDALHKSLQDAGLV